MERSKLDRINELARLAKERELTPEALAEQAARAEDGVYARKLSDLSVLLAAYHAGLGAVQGWLEDPEYSSDGKTLDKIPYSDTNWYVAKVLETRDMYKKLYG